MQYPAEQTLVLKPVVPNRKALLETAITGRSPPIKLTSAVDKHGSVQGALLMYACYGSAAEARRAQVELCRLRIDLCEVACIAQGVMI